MKQAIVIAAGTLALMSASVSSHAQSTSASSSAQTNNGTLRPIVPTDHGLVRGITTSIGHEFLGIPYAAPPVGNLRWKAPQSPSPWVAPLDASKFANHCAQAASPFGVASTTEDCLYLNVYTPPGLNVLRPVMVYIHGGAFLTGESDDYVPRALLGQDVIVVTINYRLGSLGFFADSALAAESPIGSSGNYGIMDQQAALRWVRNNILLFGGDPGNVTIFGESAGGYSVHTHLASSASKGLFARAIVESGAYQLTQPTLAQAEAQGATFATAVGCSATDLACLRAVPVGTLLANQPTNIATYSPNIDGAILTQSYSTAFASGQFNRVPVIEGANHDEFRLFVAFLFELPFGPVTAAQYPNYVAAILNLPAAVEQQVLPLVLAEYPLGNYASPSIALGAVGTDAAFACNAAEVQQLLSQYVPTYAYEFNDPNAPQIWLPPVSFPYGAYHTAELQYLFDMPMFVPRPALTADQQQLSNAMVSYWTTFANRGNPNSRSTPTWGQLTSSSDAMQTLVPPTPQAYTTTAYAADHKCAFWAQLAAAQ